LFVWIIGKGKGSPFLTRNGYIHTRTKQQGLFLLLFGTLGREKENKQRKNSARLPYSIISNVSFCIKEKGRNANLNNKITQIPIIYIYFFLQQISTLIYINIFVFVFYTTKQDTKTNL